MRAIAYLAAMSLVAFILNASASTIAQAHLPRTVSQAGAVLELVSCGVRESLWIDHYAAGLYVLPGTPITTVQDPNQPKAVRLKMISTRFVPETIPEKWLAALTGALPPEPLELLRKAYRGLNDGDVMTITYSSTTGVVVQVNGRRVTHVGQHAVIDAILSAWADGTTIESKLNSLVKEHAC